MTLPEARPPLLVPEWVEATNDGLFYLLGSRCSDCGAPAFPRREACGRCSSRSMTDAKFGPEGTLFSYTAIHQPPLGYEGQVPYVVGQAAFHDELVVQGYVEGEADSHWEIGCPIVVVPHTLVDSNGVEEAVTYAFRPRRVPHA